VIFRRYFPGFWGTILDVLLVIIVILAIYHNPTGSAHWVQERARNVADCAHQVIVFVQGI
jgi:hypothetical protein